MNFTLDDRHRSIRRFLMNALGAPPWRLRTERQPVADEERPVGVVEAGSPVTTTRSRTSIPQGNVERAQTFSIMLYPPLKTTARESRLEAETWAQLLDQAILVGLLNDDGSTLSAPEMLPVYDFAGVPAAGADRAGAAVAYGWLRADDYPVQPRQDPEDPLRFTVTCDLRVSWEQAGRERRQDEPAVGVVVPVAPGTVPPGGVDPLAPWPPPIAPVTPAVPPTDAPDPGTVPPPLGGGVLP